IEVPLRGVDDVVTIDCSELPDDPRDLCQLLSGEEAHPKYWIRLAAEYRKAALTDHAIDIVNEGLKTNRVQSDRDFRAQFHSLLATLYIQKSRISSSGLSKQEPDARNKEYWQQLATQSINDASRLNPDSVSSLISRGVLSMMKIDGDRALEEANKQFDAALKKNTRNLFAMLGKGRIMYARKNFKVALGWFQKVLAAQPKFRPDPRIGIGLCFWQLKMLEDATLAWARALELDPENSIVSALLGIASVTEAFQHVGDAKKFQSLYTSGLQLVLKAWKAAEVPIAGVVLASYYFSKRKIDGLVQITERILNHTDLAAIRGDAFLWIARGQHVVEGHDKAAQFYQLAKQQEPDLLLASLGIAQTQLIRDGVTDAKLILEGIADRHPKCVEVLSMLGSIYTRELADANFKGDRAVQKSKARAMLDKAISLIADSPKLSFTDADLHFGKAMLLDEDDSLSIIRTLEQAIEVQASLDLTISPELYNNMAVVHHLDGNYDLAHDLYKRALQSCEEPSIDSNDRLSGLRTIMSYNLGRCEEDAGKLSAARASYQKLIAQYPDYVEARARLCFMDMKENSQVDVQTELDMLLEISPRNTEVRALYGWYLGRLPKAKGLHYNEDPERRHFNHTLKHIDNYERFSLTALGNFYIRLARSIRPDSDQLKEERRKHYDMATKFFERALHYDKNNAYAAQGLGIAFAEHKQPQKALNIFTKVRETLRDDSVILNMGHCLAELHQHARAIECYEIVLSNCQGSAALSIYQCLGRTWCARGREERSAESLREALKYTRDAEKLSPAPAVKFNIAFIRFQIADVLRQTPEAERSVADLEDAIAGLQAAIVAFTQIADSPQAPFPKEEIRQRATMGKNTTVRQLERELQKQKDYESKNSAKVEQARRMREDDRKRKEQIREEARLAEESRQAALREQRRKMLEEARAWTDKRRLEDEENEQRKFEEQEAKRRRVERRKGKKSKGYDIAGSSDDEVPRKTAERQRKRGPRQSKTVAASETGSPGPDQSDRGESPERTNKKRKLYKSAAIVDSDLDDD
ncbi:hypothetical protein BCR37DRAFT_337496, partial [Protomyces lactucae-debilis]